MYLSAETDIIYRLLKSADGLQNVHVVKAYPFINKPTRLKQPVVCVSPAGFDATHCALGQTHYLCSYRIRVSVYVPQHFGTPVADETMEAVVHALTMTDFRRLQVDDIQSVDAIDCFATACTVSYQSQSLLSEDKLWTRQ